MAYWVSRPSGHFLFEDLQFLWTLSMEREKYPCICWIVEPYIGTSATFLYQNIEVKDCGDNSLHLNYLRQVFLLWGIFTVKIQNFYPHPKVHVYSMMQNRFSSSYGSQTLHSLIFLRSSMSEASFESLGKVQCASLK